MSCKIAPGSADDFTDSMAENYALPRDSIKVEPRDLGTSQVPGATSGAPERGGLEAGAVLGWSSRVDRLVLVTCRPACREDRLKVVDAIDPDTFIVFSPRKAKREVTVLTDVDCPYCAKFHLEVPELNELGVRVRYARSVSVSCARDQHEAMSDAKAGRENEPATCENPVQAHFDAGRRVGARGTPTIVTDTGGAIGGYVPYRELVERLERG